MTPLATWCLIMGLLIVTTVLTVVLFNRWLRAHPTAPKNPTPRPSYVRVIDSPYDASRYPGWPNVEDQR